ncbi:MAG: glutathione S-transferase family protein [Pseudomonadota bacterium]
MQKSLKVYGRSQSFFTRKVMGYLSYKTIPWLHRRDTSAPALKEAGWPGGIPAVVLPDGQVIWDSTSVILHLETKHPDRSILPPCKTAAFLSFLIEDYNDEWLYRPAVAWRWFDRDNALQAGWDLAREYSFFTPGVGGKIRAAIEARVGRSCAAFGLPAPLLPRWIDEDLGPWIAALSTYVATRRFLFGARPALADFALFGANAAHFIGDISCRAYLDAQGPEIVAYTHRLQEPEFDTFGDWAPIEPNAEALVALLKPLGLHYLPWVTAACEKGSAPIFPGGEPVAVSPFTRRSRGLLLGRYAQLRNPQLDEILAAAGLLRFFSDDLNQALPLPDPHQLPQPPVNRPFPADAQPAR